MRIVSDTEVSGSNIASPILAVHAGRYVAQLPGVQCGDAHFCDLVVILLIRLDIDTHEDYGLVKSEGRWLLLYVELDKELETLSMIHTVSMAGGRPPGLVAAAFAVGRRPRYRWVRLNWSERVLFFRSRACCFFAFMALLFAF